MPRHGGWFMKRWILFALLLFGGACATGNQPGGYSQNPEHFSVQPPAKWIKLNIARHYMLTKEDPFSQYILVQQRHVDKPFDHTKRTLRKGILPPEAAQVILDEIILDQSVLNFRIIENLPALVNQYEGFKLIFTYGTKDGYQFKTVYYGFLQGDWFYSIRYNAAETKFSQDDVEAFEAVIRTFKIMDPRAA